MYCTAFEGMDIRALAGNRFSESSADKFVGMNDKDRDVKQRLPEWLISGNAMMG